VLPAAFYGTRVFKGGSVNTNFSVDVKPSNQVNVGVGSTGSSGNFAGRSVSMGESVTKLMNINDKKQPYKYGWTAGCRWESSCLPNGSMNKKESGNFRAGSFKRKNCFYVE
jgi:hypothetical protein